MGYSFYNNTPPPPKLVRSNSCSHLVALPNTFKRESAYTPRSPGFAHAGDTDDKREYIHKKETQLALADFLKYEAPRETQTAARKPDKTEVTLTTEQKCRKWVVERFSRSLHKGRGEEARRASEGSPVVKKVVHEKDNSGREIGVGNTEKYAQAATADSKEMFEFGWGNFSSEKKHLQKQPESENLKQNVEGAGDDATGSAITTLDGPFPSVTLQPPAQQFLDYNLGITEQYPHLVVVNGERQERANDRTVPKVPDQNKSTFATHRENDGPTHSPDGIGPVKATQRYGHSPIQNSMHPNHSPTAPPKAPKEPNLKAVTTLPKEPYPKPRNYRSPHPGGEQAARVTPRSVRSPKTRDMSPQTGENHGTNDAKFPGPLPSRAKQDIKSERGGMDGHACPHQTTDDAILPRVYGGKEDIHDGIVFLPDITDTSFLHKCEQSLPPSSESDLDSLPAHKDQVSSRPNCRLSPILVVAELEPAIATQTVTTNEPHPPSWIFQGKATGEASEMISTHPSQIPLLKDRTPPPSKEGPRQHSNNNYSNYNKNNKNNNVKAEPIKLEHQQPSLSHSAMVAEIERKLEAKFGARISALEKQYAVLNRLSDAVLESANSTRLVGGVSKGDTLLEPAEKGVQDRLNGVGATSSLVKLEAKLDTLLALVGEGKRWEGSDIEG